jgi:hypothetical protein
MVAFVVRPALKAAAAGLALATAFASGAATSLEDEQRERQLLDRVAELQAQGGPYAPELKDALTELVLLYQERGDPDLAVVAIEQSVQVVRVNQGLHSLEQVPLMLQRIYAEEARGNDADVWQLEQELLTLVRRHPADLRTVPVLHEMADRQMAVLDRVMAGERHPHIFYGCFYKLWPTREGGSCYAGSKQNVVQGMLAEAQRNYSAAIATLLRNEQQGSEELRELEMEILRGVDLVRAQYAREYSRTGTPMPLVPAYLGADSIEPWRGRMAPVVALAGWELPYPTMGSLDDGESPKAQTKHIRIMDPYHRGRQSLRRLYAYGAATASAPLSQADAALQIADWDLLYSRNGEAVDRYQFIYAMLEQAGVSEASIDGLFSPSIPVVLPAFQPNPLLRDETRPAAGHIDVAFEITKYGRARAVEILDEMSATDDAKHDLVDLIAGSRFRPRPTDGQFGVTSRVVVRYYLSDTGAD